MKKRAGACRGDFESLAVMTGAQINVGLVIDDAGPNVRLLSVEDFIERKHQHAGVANRNSASVAFQQFGALVSQIAGWPA